MQVETELTTHRNYNNKLINVISMSHDDKTFKNIYTFI